MINFPKNIPAFLFTEYASQKKPWIMDAGEFLLSPFRTLTPYDDQALLTSFGLLREREFLEKNNKFMEDFLSAVSGFAFLSTHFTFGYSKISCFSLIPTFLYLNGKSIKKMKDLNFWAWKKIDGRENILPSKLLKGIVLTASVSFCVFTGSLGLIFLNLYGVSMPLVTLIAFTYLSLHFSAGAMLKLMAYNKDPKVKAAYDHYCAEKTTVQKMAEAKIKNPNKSNMLNEAFEKNGSQETLGTFSKLNSDLKVVVFSPLSSQDLIHLRSANKELFNVISNDIILISRIHENFSIDFINRLGISHILNALWNSPLESSLVPSVHPKDVIHWILNFDQKVRDKNLKIGKIFEYHMKCFSLSWGHESVQNPKNSANLFLMFKQNNNQSFRDKYFMVLAHENSEIAWEQRFIRLVQISDTDNTHFADAVPIYKMDEDHYSKVPLSELSQFENVDPIYIEETDFFKRFSEAESLENAII